MKKDNAKPAAIGDSAPQPEGPKTAEQAQFGQVHLDQVPAMAEHVESAEVVGESDAGESHRILAQEYHESAKLLGLSETTEQRLVNLAQREGKPADEVISAYLHEQLPRHDFYDQQVLLDMSA